MKVSEAIELLKSYKPDDELVVHSYHKSPMSLSRTFYPIMRMEMGFDWDAGKVFIVPWRKIK